MVSDWREVPGVGILRPNTIRNRTRILNGFWRWMDGRDLTPDDLNPLLLEQWIQSRLRDLAASSVVTEARNVRTWLKRHRKDLVTCWKDEVIMPNFTPPEPRALTEAEDRGVMFSTRRHQGFMLVALCRWAGLRIEEAMVLQWDSVTRDGTKRLLRVESYPDIGFEPKGHRVRTLPIGRKLWTVMEGEFPKYLEHLVPFVALREHHGEWDRWHKRPWRLALLIQEVTGLPPGTAFHALRKTFATRAAVRGVKIEVIQRWLGHANLNTTRGYIDSTLLEKDDDIELAG